MSRLVATGLAIAGRLHPTNLRVEAGERVAVIGPNGSGKTSLLHAVAGVGAPRGAVQVDGADLRATPPRLRPRLLGYVPASRDSAWPLAVEDAIADAGASAEEATHGLGALDLLPLMRRPLDALSTGERARVFLARALAPRPGLILADEPIANLDPRWRLRVLALLGSAADEGTAVLISVHDLDAALGWASRVLVLHGGQVIADASPEQVASSGTIEAVFRVRRSGAGWAEI